MTEGNTEVQWSERDASVLHSAAKRVGWCHVRAYSSIGALPTQCHLVASAHPGGLNKLTSYGHHGHRDSPDINIPIYSSR